MDVGDLAHNVKLQKLYINKIALPLKNFYQKVAGIWSF